jgi:hypothetical protein
LPEVVEESLRLESKNEKNKSDELEIKFKSEFDAYAIQRFRRKEVGLCISLKNHVISFFVKSPIHNGIIYSGKQVMLALTWQTNMSVFVQSLPQKECV